MNVFKIVVQKHAYNNLKNDYEKEFLFSNSYLI